MTDNLPDKKPDKTSDKISEKISEKMFGKMSDKNVRKSLVGMMEFRASKSDKARERRSEAQADFIRHGTSHEGDSTG